MWKSHESQTEGRQSTRPSGGILSGLTGGEKSSCQNSSSKSRDETSWVDCTQKDSIPRCGWIQSAVNLSSNSLEIQAYFSDNGQWHTVIPIVEPQSVFSVPQGAIWLPKTALLRSVHQGTQDEIEVYGVVGDGIRIVQR
jgi:hypothetical protein